MTFKIRKFNIRKQIEKKMKEKRRKKAVQSVMVRGLKVGEPKPQIKQIGDKIEITFPEGNDANQDTKLPTDSESGPTSRGVDGDHGTVQSGEVSVDQSNSSDPVRPSG